jgi:hypothetical protein
MVVGISQKLITPIIERTRNGVSEQNLANYVVGASNGGANPQPLYDAVVRRGFADAILDLNGRGLNLSMDEEALREGVPTILQRTRDGYSESTLADVVEVAGHPQWFYDEVVRHGFADAVTQIKQAKPGIRADSSSAYEGLGVLSAKVGNGYSEDHVKAFLQATGLNNLISF